MTEYKELVKKTNAIQTTDISNLIRKTDYDTKSSGIEKKLLIMIMVITVLLHRNLIS